MKRKLGILCAILVALMCACTARPKEKEEYFLYFTRNSLTSYGSAVAPQEWTGGPDAAGMMEGLLAGPAAEGLSTPFPRGLSVQSLETDSEAGMVRITLSDHYSGLTDISQTLADACIVMTLCQLPGVEAVEISTDGFWASRPASRTLRPEQMDLTSLLSEDFP